MALLHKNHDKSNITFLSDINFLINEFDVFITKYSDTKPAQCIASRPKKIARLFEKSVLNVITTNFFLKNKLIFNSRFVKRIQNLGCDITYEKSCIVVSAYNDWEKILY